MSGTIYEAAMQQMWDIMWMRRNNWPAVQACTDSELRLLWAETEERYNLYCRIADQAEQRRNPPVALVVTEAEPTEEYTWSRTHEGSVDEDSNLDDDAYFDDAAMERLYERADEVAAELESIDNEWKRRPWLEQFK